MAVKGQDSFYENFSNSLRSLAGYCHSEIEELRNWRDYYQQCYELGRETAEEAAKEASET